MVKRKTVKPAEIVVAYKGFDKDLKCRGFQFEIEKEYQHKGKVQACEGGFHACEHPLDVFSYYPPAASRFALVEQSGELSRHDSDTKIASSILRIKAELSIADIIKAAIDYTFKRAKPVDPDSPASATGWSGAASATGVRGAASATGWSGAASALGNASVAMATGFYGRARGIEGAAIVLVNRANDGSIRHVKATKVGENGIKPDTWYTLNDAGEFIEC